MGVVASLAYLGRQLRQNSRTISEEIFQNLLNDYHGAMDNLINDAAINRIWYLGLRDFDALGEDDRRLWLTQMHAFLRRYENIILQLRKYPINEGVIAGLQNQWHGLPTQPGARRFWPKASSQYSDEFVEFESKRHCLNIYADMENATLARVTLDAATTDPFYY